MSGSQNKDDASTEPVWLSRAMQKTIRRHFSRLKIERELLSALVRGDVCPDGCPCWRCIGELQAWIVESAKARRGPSSGSAT